MTYDLFVYLIKMLHPSKNDFVKILILYQLKLKQNEKNLHACNIYS